MDGISRDAKLRGPRCMMHCGHVTFMVVHNSHPSLKSLLYASLEPDTLVMPPIPP